MIISQDPATLLSTNTLRVLSFLAENTGSDFTAGELLKHVSVSKSGLYLALDELQNLHIINKLQRGKFILYSAKYDDSFIKQFKVLQNITALRPLLTKLEPLSIKIALFGSASRGEDHRESDIDLFILTTTTALIKKTISAKKLSRKIQAIIKTPAEFADLKESDRVFFHEIENGILLWERKF
jgi:predicted nucleotidyltransferase